MRLLIADDEMNLAKALRAVLEDEGHNCGVCFDGNSAIRLISQEIYDGLILDIMIPVPSIEEQKRIVAILDCFDTLCSDISAGLPAEIEARQKQYEYYLDKLLTFKELIAN